MFALILTVLSRDYNRGTIVPIQDSCPSLGFCGLGFWDFGFGV